MWLVGWAPWLTTKETKADWTSKIIDLRSSNAIETGSIEGLGKLKVEEDDNLILRNSFTPVKREKSVTGSESSYKFVGEKGVDLAAPDFSKETPTMSALKKNDTSMASDNGLYRSALLKIKLDLDELNKFVNSSDTRTLNRLINTILKVNALTLAANTFGRRIGEGSEFENIAGYSTICNGLLGLYRDHKSSVEEMTSNFQASIDLVEHGSQHALAVVDTKECSKSFTKILESGSNKPGWVQRPSNGINMLSSLSNTGSVDPRGVLIGGSQAQFEVMAARLDKLERENASLKEKGG
ncbi:unnamed protein product [Cylindrotheca closterium]|uniref:Uncharacterized protein n=1 Tax=Cylindrotheca closterium TaxID=2856 RepID=A0AAD2JK36_9STRA|nr:unnamed protein product [Cylindrotheca closterium]